MLSMVIITMCEAILGVKSAAVDCFIDTMADLYIASPPLSYESRSSSKTQGLIHKAHLTRSAATATMHLLKSRKSTIWAKACLSLVPTFRLKETVNFSREAF